MAPVSKRIKGADEDDKGFFQFPVIFPCGNDVKVDVSLIVPRSLGENGSFMLSALHLHIIYSSLVVVQVYVEPDTFSVIERIDGFLRCRHGNLPNGNAQYFF